MYLIQDQDGKSQESHLKGKEKLCELNYTGQ